MSILAADPFPGFAGLGRLCNHPVVEWSSAEVVLISRYGAMFGPDSTFLGVPAGDVDDEESYHDTEVVALGAALAIAAGRQGPRRGPRQPLLADRWPPHGEG